MYINAEEYLDDIRQKGKEIKSLRNALSAIDKDLEASAITYNPDRIHTNVPRKDGLEELAFKHIERRDKIIRALEDAITERSEAIQEAIKYINQIDQPKQREILIWFYIEGKEWSEIFRTREEEGLFEPRGAFALRDRGIDALNKIFIESAMDDIQ